MLIVQGRFILSVTALQVYLVLPSTVKDQTCLTCTILTSIFVTVFMEGFLLSYSSIEYNPV